MHYSELSALIKKYLSPADCSQKTTSEILDSTFIRDSLETVIGTHKATDELGEPELNALIEMLYTRFDYIRNFPLIYTENTTSPFNQLCVALAIALERATKKNRFQLLIRSLKDTACLTGNDLCDDTYAVTDFILTRKQKYFIDVEETLRIAENDTKLRHSQRVSRRKRKTLLLSADEKQRIMNHSEEAKDYYTAISERHEFIHNGKTFGAILQDLADGLEQGSTLQSGAHAEENAGSAANLAIVRFRLIYKTLPKKTRTWLKGLEAKGENPGDSPSTFGDIWNTLASNQGKKIKTIHKDKTLTLEEKKDRLAHVHLDHKTCAVKNNTLLQQIIAQHKVELFVRSINNQAIQANSITAYDQAVADKKHWFKTKMLHLRQGRAQLASALSEAQDQALSQLILSKLSQRAINKLIAQLRAALQIKMVAAGGFFTLFLSQTDELYACGYNMSGELGVGDKKPLNYPTKMVQINDKIMQMTAGQYHSLLLTENRKLYACGHNGYGQLGTGDDKERLVLTEVPGIAGEVARVEAGHYQSFLLMKTGEVYAFGRNDYGQLGLGDNEKHLIPTLVPGMIGKIAQVASGGYHTLVLMESGELFVSGYNKFGQLGLGDTEDRHKLTKVKGIEGKIIQVAAGENHSLMLTEAGELYACGYNVNGQLGQGARLGTWDKSLTPIKVIGIEGKIRRILVSYSQNFIFMEDGRVYAFGKNSCGQLGTEIDIDRYEPMLMKRVERKISTLAGGSAHTMLLMDNHRVYALGTNANGQLGLQNLSHTHRPIAVSLAGRNATLLQDLEARVQPVVALSAAPTATMFAAKPVAVNQNTLGIETHGRKRARHSGR